MKTAPPLQRGMACLCCRKRKMKCDGLRPVCTQCLKSNRGTECHYYEKKHISRTQLLQQKVAKLEARLRELEAEQEASTSGSSSSSSPPNLLSTSGDPLDINASIGDTLLLGSGASSVNEWDLRLPSLSLSPPISYGNVSGFSSDIHGEDIGGPSSAVRLDPAAVSRSSSMRPSTSNSSTLKWWEDTSTFCENKQRLLQIFFSHRHQCAFDVHVGRFQASLHLAAPSQPHPALMDAIYLLACYFSRMPQLSELESCFLKRALQGISDALHKQDRMVHVLQAACLIAVYFFCQGRVLEGYYHSSTSARLAIDLGLHQLHPSDGHIVQTSAAGLPHRSVFPVEATFPLPPPADTIEHAERIAAFWQIFIIDRAWSVATGLPSALPDDDHPRSQIETLWPMSVADMSLSLEGSDLFDMGPGLSTNTFHISPYRDELLMGDFSTSTITLRAKAVMLFERTARFSASPRSDPDWAEHSSLEMSIAQFSASLPGFGIYQNQFASPSKDINLVNIYILVHASTIHLHRAYIDSQRASLEKCLVSASAVVALVRGLQDDEYGFLDPISSTCWRCVADVYEKILDVVQMRQLQCDIRVLTEGLSFLRSAIHQLAQYFPVAAKQ